MIAASTDDLELVNAARDGDRAALEVLLRRHHDRVAAVCLRITGDVHDAADATQEALIAIARGIRRFDGRSSFSTWVYRIATNASLDELRRRRRRAVPQADSGSETAAASGPSAIDVVDDRALLVRALAELPDEYRLAVVLRDVGDLDYADISEVLGIPPGTVRSRIARGRAALARALKSGNRSEAWERPTTAPDGETLS